MSPCRSWRDPARIRGARLHRQAHGASGAVLADGSFRRLLELPEVERVATAVVHREGNASLRSRLDIPALVHQAGNERGADLVQVGRIAKRALVERDRLGAPGLEAEAVSQLTR